MKAIRVGLGWWGMRDMPLEKRWELARELGFRTVETGIGERPGSVSPGKGEKGIRKIREQADASGIDLFFATMRNDFLVEEEDLEREIRMAEACLQAVAWLGAKRVRMYAGLKALEATGEGAYLRMVDALKRCAKRADALGLRIALETMGAGSEIQGATRFLPTVMTDRKWLSRLMDDLPPGIGVTFDPANLKAAAGEPIDWVLPIIGERICYVHLKDWKPGPEGWLPCAVGEASLPYREIIPAIPYDGIYLIEYEEREDFADGVERSIEALRRYGFSVVRA